MPLIATRGAASAQGFGEFAQAAAPVYIEDVFSTYLYAGTGASQTITNGIDLSGKGGLVWTKVRNNIDSHWLGDTVRGTGKVLETNSTNASRSLTSYSAFGSTGYTVDQAGTDLSGSGKTYASWTFREQPKFFDIVTYTGNGSAPRAISHNLASTPGCIIIKRTDSTGDWWVFHRSAPNQGVAYPGIGGNLYLNYADAADSGANPFLSAVSSTTFTLSTNQNATMNINGATYVAYLFAHDAGGFGLTGLDNVISCGSFTGNTTVNLGFEPQWILLKNSGAAENWFIHDNMRGWPVSGDAQVLYPNLSSAEGSTSQIYPNATGFSTLIGSGTYIYIAIRRGPMKTPTTGTSVFTPVTRTGTGANATVNASILTDTTFIMDRSPTWQAAKVFDRLRGATRLVYSNTTSAEVSDATTLTSFANMTGYVLGDDSNNYDVNRSASSYINWNFRRAPGFFDEVCYTGNGGGLGTTVPHNLGVLPELIIVKARSGSGNWWVAHKDVFFNGILNLTDAWNTFAYNASISFSTATQLSTAFSGNTNGVTFVAYLFASVAGVSKVGSYTGTGALQTVNCGFTTGARFVLIKRTDSTGDWWVYDSARGISSSNDPYLFLNSTAAEVTNTNYVDTTSVGFQVTAAAPAGLNANGGTYIFLAIA